jgi:hypothetical protein
MTARLPAALLAAATLAAALAAPAAAAEEDLRAKVEELEKRLREIEAHRGAPARDPDLEAAVERYLERRRGARGDAEEKDESYLLGGTPRPANRRFRIGGYATVLYRSPDDPSQYPAFVGLRVVPQLSFDISKGIDFAMEIEFERGGIADEFLDDSEVLVEYAETRFHVSEAFVPKAGILLIPFLRYNLHHDDPIWNLQDRPFTATRVFKTALQQPGVGVEGVIPLGGGHSFNYNAALTNGLDDEVDNDGFEDARTPFGEDNNNNKTAWVRLGVAPRLAFLDAADLGASFCRGAMNDGGTPTVLMEGWGVDGKLTKGRFDLIGEWTGFHYRRPSSQPAATFPRRTEGAFLQVDAHLLRGLPESENGLVGKTSELVLAVRWEFSDLNGRVRGASPGDDARALTVGLAFRFTPKTVVRIERKQETSPFPGPAGRDRGMWVASLSTYF